MNRLKKRKVTLNRIIEFVCDFYGVSEEEIINQNRKKDVVRARQVIIYLIRERLNKSFPLIGRKLGNRDHTTIIYAYNKIRIGIRNSRELKEDIENITTLIADIAGSNFRVGERIKNNRSNRRKRIRYKKTREQFVNRFPLVVESIRDIPKLNIGKKLLFRQNNIVKKYKEGMTLEEIGKSCGLTRERVRQIVDRGLIYGLGEVLEQGVKLDLKEFLREEKRKHTLALRKIRGVLEKNFTKKEKRWSRYYDNCRGCGTITEKHHSHGYCRKCYPKTKIFKEMVESSRLRNIERWRERTREYSKRPEVIAKRKKKEDLKYFDGNREKAIIQSGERCQKCGLSREENYRKYSEDLRVIHISNKDDHSLNNLLPLCKECFYKELKRRRDQKRSE